MPATRCCHIRLNGARCTMPAIDGKDFCFNHDRLRVRARSKPCPPPTTHWTSTPLVDFHVPETRDDILDSLYCATDAFARHMIDHRQLAVLGKQMELMLRTIRENERQKEKIRQLEQEPPITRVRYEADGTPIAYRDDQPEPQPTPAPAPDPDPQPQATQDSAQPAILPTVTACVEEPGLTSAPSVVFPICAPSKRSLGGSSAHRARAIPSDRSSGTISTSLIPVLPGERRDEESGVAFSSRRKSPLLPKTANRSQPRRRPTSRPVSNTYTECSANSCISHTYKIAKINRRVFIHIQKRKTGV